MARLSREDDPDRNEIAARRRDWATVFSWLLAAGALAAATLAASSPQLDPSALGAAGIAAACLAGLAAVQSGVARGLERALTARRLAFAAALIGAPALVALAGFPLLALGVGLFLIYAPIYAAASYLLIGAPLAWRATRTGAPGLGACLLGATVANLGGVMISALLFGLALGNPWAEALELTLYLHGVGLVIAPLYGLAFWAVLRRLAPPAADATGGADARA